MRPSVALESTVIAHGLPAPDNLQVAQRLEQRVQAAGAEPRTVGLIHGAPVVGMSAAQVAALATATDVAKVSLRDLAWVAAQQRHGATTVAATMWLAHRAGIAVFATGGIGGVHRGSGPPGSGSFDVSNDLEVLAQLPMVVVCAGPKAILDLPATREALETRGVPVVGYRTDEMPAFYSRTSGLPVDVRCETPEEIATLYRAHRSLGLSAALLVTNPIPEAAAIPAAAIAPVIEQAHAEAQAQGLRAAAITPFLLKRLGELTGARSLRANIALLENNARLAAEVAVALAQP